MRQSHIPTDAQIIARTRERPAEFSELYRRHARAVFRYAASRIGREHADDVVSETLLVAFERRNAYDLEVASALPWLLGIATRLIRKRRREEAAAWRLRARVCDLGNEEAEYAGHDPTSELDERLDAQRRVAQAADAISSLPARDRDVLMLTAWSDLDAAEIAVALGIPEGTVWSRLSRARRAMRTLLDADQIRRPENSHEDTIAR